MPPKNRRKDARVRKRLKVEYGERGFDHKAILHNISVGGIFISASRLFKKGTRVHLHIIDPKFDFYAEGLVVRQKRVDQALRHIEAQGMGIQLLSPADLIRTMIPRAARQVDTQEIVCSSPEEVQKLIREQLVAGIIVVPVGGSPPAPGTAVEFSLRVDIDPGRTINGEGRVVQILGQGETRQAVLEVKDAAKLRAELEGVAR
jgi:hypothetical protein